MLVEQSSDYHGMHSWSLKTLEALLLFVLQGMGEPLSNYDAVLAAVGLMADPRESQGTIRSLRWHSTWLVLLDLLGQWS